MDGIRFDEGGLGRLDAYMAGYVADGRLAGSSMLLWQGGTERFTAFHGVQDLESGRPVRRDTIFRIYSMTKPVASIALMMLWERGRFDLDGPVARFLPAFAAPSVYVPAADGGHITEPARGPITIRQLLSHTAGLILPAFSEHPLREIYIARGVNGSRSEGTLAEVIDRLAGLPLLSHPGTRWEYSMATDVVGRLVEVIDGRRFDVFLAEEIFGPLGMADTGFHLPADRLPRFAANYTRDGDGPLSVLDPVEGSRYLREPIYHSGNGGLLSTMDDYLRFCLMLRNRGSLDDARILAPGTVDLMTRNHLDGDMAAMDAANFAGQDWRGIGFGLGFSVILDAARAGHGNAGLYAWSGAASTYFWIDPAADLIALYFSQFMPSRTYPVRTDLRRLVYGSFDTRPAPVARRAAQDDVIL